VERPERADAEPPRRRDERLVALVERHVPLADRDEKQQRGERRGPEPEEQRQRAAPPVALHDAPADERRPAEGHQGGVEEAVLDRREPCGERHHPTEG
jgi:hypothetical protein